MTTTAHKIIDLLEQGGVEHVFGLPSGQMNSYYASLAESDIRHVLARSEAGAAIMADGYARTIGSVGICDGVGASGAANLSVGIIEAYGASSPLLALSGDNSRSKRGKEIIQDFDNSRFLTPMTKRSIDPETPNRGIEAIRNGLQEAVSGVPGPVHVNLTRDVLTGMLDDETIAEIDAHDIDFEYPLYRPAPEQAAVEDAAQTLSNAETPLILAGEGALRSRAWTEIQDLAEAAEIPVVTSMNGKGIIDESSELAAGVAGRWGYWESANEQLKQADAILGLGCRFGDLTTDAGALIRSDASLIHVDLDEEWLGKTQAIDIPIYADIRTTARALCDEFADRTASISRSRLNQIRETQEEWLAEYESALTSSETPIDPLRVVNEISRTAPADAIVVAATSYAGFATAAFHRVTEPGMRYLQARGSDGINYCLPQALGAQIASPDSPVIAVTGDGGLGYHIAELETAARENIPLTVVVLNNDSFGSSKVSQRVNYDVDISTDLESTSFEDVARGFGCEAVTIDSPAALEGALSEAYASSAPHLLDVKVGTQSVPPGGGFGGGDYAG